MYDSYMIHIFNATTGPDCVQKTDHLIAPPLVYIAIDRMSKAGIATNCSAASASSNGASGIPAGSPTISEVKLTKL